MATVCAMLLVAGGHETTMWGARAGSIERLRGNREQTRLLPGARVPDAVRLVSDDAEALAGATMVVSAVPTQYMRGVWQRLARHGIDAGVPVVSVAKGIENDTMLRPTEILANVAGPGLKTAALSGPNIAAELARGLPATAVAASRDVELARRVQATFSRPHFRVYTNDDVLGVELAGAMKNIIAIAAGILDGMRAGNNAKAALVTRGLVEITRLGVAMGARAETFMGLAGLGDLLTTCVSPEGRNRSLGEQIGGGRPLKDVLAGMTSVVEGIPTTRSVCQLAERHGVEMPITQMLAEVLFGGIDPQRALANLMSRERKAE